MTAGMEVEVNRHVGWRKHSNDRRRHADGEHHAERACGRRHHQALDEQLLSEPAASGANRDAQRHLAFASGPTGGQQTRDVGARR